MGYVLRRTRLLQRVATLPWNERQVGYGISGKFGVESVATLPWNRWQLSRGIRKRAANALYVLAAMRLAYLKERPEC